MKSIGLFYGSTTGNTESVAKAIKGKLAGKLDVTLTDVARAKAADVEPFSTLILGTSTWGLGDLQDDWEGFLPKLLQADLSGKTVALFGVGDSQSYPDTFTDGMGILYEALSAKGCKIIGTVSASDYSFSDSKALIDGKMAGLALDVDNEDSLTESRIEKWLESIEKEL